MSDWVKAKLIILAIKLSAKMSLSFAYRLGRIVGALVYKLNLRPARIARKNLGIACPHETEDLRETMVAKRMHHLGMLVFETGIMWEQPVDQTLGLVRSIRGEQLLLDAIKSEQGLIALVPHHGNWELAGLFLSSYSEMAALYKPPRIAQLDGYMRAVRGRKGSELVPTTQRGVMRLFTILKEGGLVGILPDQSPDDGAIEVPFMGHPARTMRLASRLIHRTQACVLIVAAVRRETEDGFDLIISDADPAVYDSDEYVSTAQINKGIERIISERLEQYQWEYKRYRGTTRYAEVE